jgi:hypothetical protein
MEEMMHGTLASADDDDFEYLRQAIFRASRELAVGARDDGDEQRRKRCSLESIGDCVEWAALDQFDANQLFLLELMIAYWRECEVEAGAPEPRRPTKEENDEAIELATRRDLLALRTGVLRRVA